MFGCLPHGLGLTDCRERANFNAYFVVFKAREFGSSRSQKDQIKGKANETEIVREGEREGIMRERGKRERTRSDLDE